MKPCRGAQPWWGRPRGTPPTPAPVFPAGHQQPLTSVGQPLPRLKGCWREGSLRSVLRDSGAGPAFRKGVQPNSDRRHGGLWAHAGGRGVWTLLHISPCGKAPPLFPHAGGCCCSGQALGAQWSQPAQALGTGATAGLQSSPPDPQGAPTTGLPEWVKQAPARDAQQVQGRREGGPPFPHPYLPHSLQAAHMPGHPSRLSRLAFGWGGPAQSEGPDQPRWPKPFGAALRHAGRGLLHRGSWSRLWAGGPPGPRHLLRMGRRRSRWAAAGLARSLQAGRGGLGALLTDTGNCSGEEGRVWGGGSRRAECGLRRKGLSRDTLGSDTQEQSTGTRTPTDPAQEWESLRALRTGPHQPHYPPTAEESDRALRQRPCLPEKAGWCSELGETQAAEKPPLTAQHHFSKHNKRHPRRLETPMPEEPGCWIRPHGTHPGQTPVFPQRPPRCPPQKPTSEEEGSSLPCASPGPKAQGRACL